MLTAQKLVRVAFFLLLISALVISVTTRGVAADDYVLPASAADITPLKAGDRAPAFTVRTVDNERYRFDPDNLERPTVLISFRGGWCPYCNMHLSELKDVIPEIKAAGVDVLFLSGDRPDLLISSLKRETREAIAGLDYEILSDADIKAAVALGIAFRASEKTIAGRHKKGQDIEGSSMEQSGALAVPAVFVVDQSGEITFTYVNADYKIRLPAEELKTAAMIQH